MKYCSNCGENVIRKIPLGDSFERNVCPSCKTVHYQNPKIVVGCIPVWQDKILLCRRAIEPRVGYWTFPAGFMECNETMEAGAARETVEEACAKVKIGSLLSVINVTHAHQVHISFRAEMLDGKFGVGEESLEVELVDEQDIPWQEIAFPSVEYALKKFVMDRTNGVESHYVHEVDRNLYKQFI